jgi:hypothetical protein
MLVLYAGNVMACHAGLMAACWMPDSIICAEQHTQSKVPLYQRLGMAVLRKNNRGHCRHASVLLSLCRGQNMSHMCDSLSAITNAQQACCMLVWHPSVSVPVAYT